MNFLFTEMINEDTFIFWKRQNQLTATIIPHQVLRLELAKFGVDVVTIQPGDFSKATHLLDR